VDGPFQGFRPFDIFPLVFFLQIEPISAHEVAERRQRYVFRVQAPSPLNQGLNIFSEAIRYSHINRRHDYLS
jgi:hypothetical protein